MTNEKVMISFLEGKSNHTMNLFTEGTILVNYQTRIAYKRDNKLYLNISKYSRTTSKIQGQLRRLIPMYYTEENIIEYEGDRYGR